MLTQLVCECGFELEIIGDSTNAKHRCPRCGRKIFADEKDAAADFDSIHETPQHSDIDTAITAGERVIPSTRHAPLVAQDNDVDATIDLSDLKKPDTDLERSTPFEVRHDAPPPQTEHSLEVPYEAVANPFAYQTPPPQVKHNDNQPYITPPPHAALTRHTALPSDIPRGSGTRVNLTDRVMRPIHKPSVPNDARIANGSYGIHRIIRVHQKGGMGRILVAYDTYLKREVALKELHAEIAGDDSTVRRFIGEAEITAQLEHPGVVPVHYLGTDKDGLPYYTMKMVRGETLQEAIKAYHRKPTKTGLTVLIRRLISASKTIAFAHSKGVIHRDLKPANIMIGEHGDTLVMDWGLAKPFTLRDQESSVSYMYRSKNIRPELTMVGAIVGTPAFMSPEQAMADEGMIGPLSDVFALGTVLYYLLAGQTAFSGRSTQEVLNKVRAAKPIKPSSFKPNVPRGLEAICFKAMMKEPHNRYQGAQEFVDDLCRWLDDEPILAEKETLLHRWERWLVKHRGAVIAVPTMALLLSVVLIFAGIWFGGLYDTRGGALDETVLTTKVDLLEYPDVIFAEGSQGINIRSDSRQTGGKLLTCKVTDVSMKEKHRVVILHAPPRRCWDLAFRHAFLFSIFEQSDTDDAISNFSVRFGQGSSYYEYRPSETTWNNRRRSNWFEFIVPFAAPSDTWKKTAVGIPSQNQIEWIEFHFDVAAPLSISFDNVMFANEKM